MSRQVSSGQVVSDRVRTGQDMISSEQIMSGQVWSDEDQSGQKQIRSGNVRSGQDRQCHVMKSTGQVL